MHAKTTLAAIISLNFVLMAVASYAAACINDGPPQVRMDVHIALASNFWAKQQKPLDIMPMDLLTLTVPSGTADQWDIQGLDAWPTVVRTLSLQEMRPVLASTKAKTMQIVQDVSAYVSTDPTKKIYLGAIRPGTVQLTFTKHGGTAHYTVNLRIQPRTVPVDAEATKLQRPGASGMPLTKC